jgi:hypothetical protein
MKLHVKEIVCLGFVWLTDREQWRFILNIDVIFEFHKRKGNVSLDG